MGDASDLLHEPVAPLVLERQLPPEYGSEMPETRGESLLSPILRKFQLLHPHLFAVTINPSAPATKHPFCPSPSSPFLLRLASALTSNPPKIHLASARDAHWSLTTLRRSAPRSTPSQISPVTGSSAMVSAQVSTREAGGSSKSCT